METGQVVASEPPVLLELLMPDEAHLTVESARFILRLTFTQESQDRIQELMDKNQESQISPSEKEELGQMVRAGTHLATLKAKARRFLKSAGHA
jgi:hypothetical protein